MVCIGLVGCRHVHQSVTGYYILMALMIIGTIFGMRFLLFILTRCLQGRQQSSTATHNNEIMDMQVRQLMAMHHDQQQQQQQQQRSGSVATDSSVRHDDDDDWQSKLVIAAGDDHVSCIARPCPHPTAAEIHS